MSKLEGLDVGNVWKSFEKYNFDMEEFDNIDEFEKIAENSHDYMIDLVREIREAIMLPDNIEAPFSSVTFRWREDFVEAHRDNARFVNRAVRALSGKHPFRSFKMAVYDHDLKKEWFAFEFGSASGNRRSRTQTARFISLMPIRKHTIQDAVSIAHRHATPSGWHGRR